MSGGACGHCGALNSAHPQLADCVSVLRQRIESVESSPSAVAVLGRARPTIAAIAKREEDSAATGPMEDTHFHAKRASRMRALLADIDRVLDGTP